MLDEERDRLKPELRTMLDAVLGAMAVLTSLAAAYSIIFLQYRRPADARGMVGLAATVVHLLLSMALPAAVWIIHKPASPLAFVASVLVFYWLSLIVLVLAIIRWLRAGTAQSAKSSVDRGPDSNSRREDRL